MNGPSPRAWAAGALPKPPRRRLSPAEIALLRLVHRVRPVAPLANWWNRVADACLDDPGRMVLVRHGVFTADKVGAVTGPAARLGWPERNGG